MLVIRAEQMRALERHMREDLRRKLVEALADLDPDAMPAQLVGCATEAIELGMRLGFQAGDSYAALASLLLDLGPRFASHPRIAPLLHDLRVRPEDRLTAVLALNAAAWDRIRADLRDADHLGSS